MGKIKITYRCSKCRHIAGIMTIIYKDSVENIKQCPKCHEQTFVPVNLKVILEKIIREVTKKTQKGQKTLVAYRLKPVTIQHIDEYKKVHGLKTKTAAVEHIIDEWFWGKTPN